MAPEVLTQLAAFPGKTASAIPKSHYCHDLPHHVGYKFPLFYF
jgi:hypothetical protein